METPQHLKYSRSHEWTDQKGDGVVVGITDYAQDQLGDVVFVELPKVGDTVGAGDAVAVVESVKTASDIYAPVAGRITAVNETLLDAPEMINTSPYGEGWIFRMEPADAAEIAGLLDAAGYLATVEEG